MFFVLYKLLLNTYLIQYSEKKINFKKKEKNRKN